MRMIKFLYLVVALMLMVSTAAVAAESPNYFRPGTIWIYEASSVGPGSMTKEVSEWTGQEMEIGGFKAMEMWRKYGDQTPRLMTYLRVDGDKVYFLTDKDGSDWRLLYDFSLQSGDDCTVWWFNGSIEYDNISPIAEYLVCDEIMANNCADSVAQMKMLNFHSKDDYENEPEDYLQKSVWLKGVGNDGGPLHTFWGDGIDAAMVEQHESPATVRGYARHEIGCHKGQSVIGSGLSCRLDICPRAKHTHGRAANGAGL